jgi:hypothetical protein
VAEAPPHDPLAVGHPSGAARALQQSACWQVGRVDAHTQQSPGYRLSRIQQVVQCASQVLSRDGGE